MGAADGPCSPVLEERHHHDLRASARREAYEPGVVLQFLAGLPAALMKSSRRAARCRFCRRPRYSAGRARTPVPPSFTTPYMPSTTVFTLSAIQRPLARLSAVASAPSPGAADTTCRPPRGRRWPAPVAAASRSPRPVRSRPKSFRPRTTSAGSCGASTCSEGIMPSSSCGRSMPVFWPKPAMSRVERDLVDAQLVADVVEVDVAGMHDAAVHATLPCVASSSAEIVAVEA